MSTRRHDDPSMRIPRHSRFRPTTDLRTDVHDDSTVEALERLGESIGGGWDRPGYRLYEQLMPYFPAVRKRPPG
ncbi:hypothetical protein ABZ234_27355 [Nocardiopsis sp. NPDC006198]|uniref:hypothetical protein n=1 Tax=Nocardiopsis sp. NPDC006198 TaxID=3154472 RepID=UPI0033B4B291